MGFEQDGPGGARRKGAAGVTAEEVWARYQAGIRFKCDIGLYDTVTRNERFFAGDQWAGVRAPDLPKPVVNFIKRACQQRIGEVRVNPVRVIFTAEEYPAQQTEDDPPAGDGAAQLLNSLFRADWERLKMDALSLDGLQDACISGDCILYTYWDAGAVTGQAARGQAEAELVDNVNYYPGDPNDRRVQTQPYIILARREAAADVAAQAKQNGMPPPERDMIAPDRDVWTQSGDMAVYELADPAQRKCVTLLLLRRDAATGHIFAQKSVRGAVVRPEWDTGLSRYPLAMMNWELRKNCCHGCAEITGLVPVQRYVNQMYAMAMLFTMQSACPKPLFNQSMIRAWSTAVGEAVPVNGDVNAAARYMEPPKIASDAFTLPETLIRRTMEMLGVSDIELGNITPTNTSALALARNASTIPVESIRTRFYAMMEDFARNWLDMQFACCTVPRWRTVGEGGERRRVVFDTAALRRRLWSVTVEVGQGELWSEAASVQTLTKLFDAGAITATQYIERLPEGYIPRRAAMLGEMRPRARTEKE